MIRKVLILTIIAIAVLGVLCFESGRSGAVSSDTPAATDFSDTSTQPAPPELSPLEGVICGISLQLHNGDVDGVDGLIDEIAKTSANTVCLVIHGYQENASSNSIFIDARKIPSDDDLAKIIRYATKKKLKVMIMPVILLSKRRGSEWRGQIKPANWDEWWNDYTSFVMHYAKIARQEGVAVLAVGSELITTETQTQQWRTLIEKVRGEFKGSLTYSANWDHYEVPQFWELLDMVGMTTYYDLAAGKTPSLENMLAKWAEIRKKILTWQQSVKKPIIFTEVGWPNQTTAAEYPWNYYKAPDKPAPKLQAECFEAFFKTWCDEPALAGVLVWEWRYHPSVEMGPDKDTTYCPAGKPAMKVINRYFRDMRQVKPATKPVAKSE